jgi:hypothetical protein
MNSDEKAGVRAIRFDGESSPVAEIKTTSPFVRTYTSCGMRPGDRLIGCHGYTLNDKIVSLGFIVWNTNI